MSRPPAHLRPAAAQIALAGLLLGVSSGAQATFLGSPDTFEVNINSSGPGTFGQITLAGVDFDLGIEIQRQYILGSELGGNPTVTIVPGDVPSATYTTTVLDFPALEVTVDTSLLGPLRDTSRPNMLMRQALTITNNGSSATVIDGMSLYVPAFERGTNDFGGDETARADAQTGVSYATDGSSSRFAAGAGNPDDFNSGFQVDELGNFPFDPLASDLTGATGPVEATDFDLAAMGFGLWTSAPVAPGDSVTMRFSYLFSLNETMPPASFPAPAAATGLLLLAGAPALTLLRRRCKRTAGGDRQPDSSNQQRRI